MSNLNSRFSDLTILKPTPGKKFHSHAFYKTQFRTLVTRTDVLIMATLMTLFCSVLTPGQYLFEFNFMQRLSFNAVATTVFLWWTWYGMGSTVWWCVRRNIPWIWAEIAFYFPVAMMVVVGIKSFLIPGADIAQLAWLFFVIYVNIVVIVTISLLVLQNRILNEFAIDPKTVPL